MTTSKEIQSQTNQNQSEENSDFRILIIDDNPEIHKDFLKILTPLEQINNLNELKSKVFGGTNDKANVTLPKFQIDSAMQGKEGFEKIQDALKTKTPYALAFVDVRMPPGWDGIETIKQIWTIDSNIQIVICTAFSDYTWEETISQLGTNDNLLILKKPFDNVAVRQLAFALTKKWHLMLENQEHTTSLQKDITEKTISLQHSLSLTRSTLESSTDGIVVVNNQNEIIDHNKKFLELWQIPSSIMSSKNYKNFIQYALKHINNPENYRRKFNKIINNLHMVDTDIINFKDGRIFEQYTQPQNFMGENVGRVWSFRDITKRAMLEKKLEMQATHDTLTGLPNRLLLLDRIQQAISESARTHSIITILFLDLDRFKLVNDSLTHQVGDELLKIVSSRLKSIVRAEDTIARHGGDEFVIVISHLKEENKTEQIAQKIIHNLNKTFDVSGRKINIGASIGITFYPKDGEEADILLRNADLAMYQSKALGGNQYQFYSPELNTKALLRLEREHELQNALKNKEFFLCYQPQINITNNSIVSVEALLRWNHPQRGTLLPAEFLPLTEETGLIVPIGEWVLREACLQTKKWQDNGKGFFRMGVNVASAQLLSKNFPNTIKKILKETKLDPKYLEMEVTENVIITNPEVTHTINEISNLGVNIALDDFGTGNSTLSSLTKVHIDRLKIDRSFVQNININNNDEVIIRAIISMSEGLEYEILAEGVETQEQIDFFKNTRCNIIQGFYFGKPLNKEEMENLLSINMECNKP